MKLKIIIAVCLFQVIMFGQNNIKSGNNKNSHFFPHTSSNAFFESTIFKNEDLQREFAIYIGTGISPFQLLAGAGYFINNNFESTLKLGGIYYPSSVDAYLVAVGTKYYEEQFSTITYSFEVGGLFSKTSQQESRNLNGISLEANFGYLFQTKIGIYISPNLSLTYLSQKKKKPGLLPGINLVLGWILTK